MKVPLLLAAIMLPLTLQTPAAAEPPSEYEFKVTTNQPESLAKIGDTVAYKVVLLRAGQPVTDKSFHYRLSWDYFDGIRDGDLAATAEGVTLNEKATRPGFLRLEAEFTPEGGKRVVGEASVGVEPTKIVSPVTMPDDFDTFWAAKRQLALAEPMHPQMTPVDSGNANCEIMDLQINCPGGRTCSGYYGRPKNAKPGTLPAVLFVHSAGVWSSWLAAAQNAGKWNVIAYDLNAHGVPNGKDRPFYEALERGELKEYCFRGLEDREQAYFLGMYMRIAQHGLQFLTSQPEWDGKTLIVIGGSQGGGQAIVAAALDPHVTAVVANIPALGNQTGYLGGQPAGWPRMLVHGNMPKAPLGDYNKKIADVSRYFDTVNFARRIKTAEVRVAVGFVDTTCPPTSVYAMFNSLATPSKQIVGYPTMGHFSGNHSMEADASAWAAKYIEEHRKPTGQTAKSE